MSNFYDQGGMNNQQGGSTTPNDFYGGGGYNSEQSQQSSGGYNNSNTSSQQGGQQSQQQQQQQQNYGYSQPNVNQWQPSSATSQQQPMNQARQRPQQQQQQQQQAPAAFWNPGAAAAVTGLVAQAASGGLNNEAMLDWAMKGGSAAWQSGGASIIPGFDSTMLMLRSYFAVDNKYVKRKMQKLLFPFLSKQWKRLQNDNPGGLEMIEYALPHSDENAPDLYIPAMSLITYCLLCALCYGTAGQFNPEVVQNIATKCFVTQILEVLLIRLGFYLLEAPVALLDLFSYTGYKYLGLSLNMVFGILLGHLGYGTYGFYVTFMWTASAAAFFMLKTMANNIPTVTATAGPKREAVVLAFAVSQAATMWFVSQTKFL